MRTLLDDLAHLSGLKDRQALAFALVQLLLQHKPWALTEARLMCGAGPADDTRWVTLARLRRGDAQPSHDAVWLDTSALPRFAELPLHEAAIVTEAPAADPRDACHRVFPVNTAAHVCSVLETRSAAPLDAQAQADIDAVLRLFDNLHALLDYGEKDTLTELLNRKTFDAAFLRAAQEQEPQRPPDHAERRSNRGGSYWLAVLDIDHFKRVNDTWGHLIGDEVLLLMARLMRASFRIHDQLYRFGGEEFVVLLRCNTHDQALGALERLRRKVQEHGFPQVGHITVSIGFSSVDANDTPSGAFDRADRAVYHAKTHGRNQVCSFTDLVARGLLEAPTAPEDEVDFF